MTIDVIIPTYKPDNKLLTLLDRLAMQTMQPERILLINTEKEYLEQLISEKELLEKYQNLEIHHIRKADFDHAGTRNLGVQKSTADAFLLMTQDALPKSESLIKELAGALEEEGTAVAYARQLPSRDCAPYERYTRKFNYPEESRRKTEADKKQLGIKTYFCSNVCAMYDRKIFDELGGFSQPAIFNEDMVYAGTALQAGFGITYVAGARVVHSHNYNMGQQFHRNFDIGVSQAQHPEIFGGISSESEGKKFVKSTIVYLQKEGKTILIPYYIMLCGARFIGFKLGKNYRRLPNWLILKCTMNRNYWKPLADQ